MTKEDQRGFLGLNSLFAPFFAAYSLCVCKKENLF